MRGEGKLIVSYTTNYSVSLFTFLLRSVSRDPFLVFKFLYATFVLQVLTSELESKVVGLYFLAPTPDGIELTRKLLHVWNLLPDEKRDAFEIVIINKAPFNRRTVKALLEDKFGLTIPWYIIEVCGKKLSYIFERDYSGILTRQETYGEGDLIVHMEDKYQSPTYFTVNIKELTEGQIKDSLEMKIAGCFPLELKDNQFTNEAEEKEKEREKKEVTCEVDAKEKLKENEFILEAEENDVGKENEIEYEKRTSTKGLAEEKGLIEEVEEDGEYSEPEEPKQWTVNVGDEHKLLDLLFSGTDTDDLIDSRMRGVSLISVTCCLFVTLPLTSMYLWVFMLLFIFNCYPFKIRDSTYKCTPTCPLCFSYT